MAEEEKPKRLEIAHVLFMDIVGYSKLPTDEQSIRLDNLGNRARHRGSSRSASGKRLRPLPTGDGMALVFFG